MNSATFSRQKNNILLLGFIVVFAILLSSRLSQISDKISDTFNYALSSKGGRFEALSLIFAPIVCLVWLWLVFIKKEYLTALFFQIIIFPFTYKAKSAFAINAYVSQTGYVQKISLTTFLIIILFIILLSKGLIIRPKIKVWRIFERLILLYAISLTITQFFNHSIYSAIWLSIGGIWQFVFLFYILSSLITTHNKILLLFKSMICFTFVNILMRVFSEEQVIAQSLTSQIIRFGAGAMGPAVSYGGYLAIIITIAIALYRSTNKLLFLLLALLIFVELMNTFTRGAILSLTFLGLIFYWRKERKYYYRFVLIVLLIVIIWGGIIWDYISYRGMYIGSRMLQLDSVMVRISIFQTYFNKIFNYSLIGNGIGNYTLVSNSFTSPLVAHNIIVSLIDQTGIIVTFLFLFLYFYSLSISIKMSKQNSDRNSSTLSVFITIALIQWFFFANTTSTLLNWYYPYEGSAIFWILLFSPHIINLISQNKIKRFK